MSTLANNEFHYHNLSQNIEKSDYILTKHVLLETLANAAHPRSRPLLMKFAAPNHGHASWRHGALNGLRNYHDLEVETQCFPWPWCLASTLMMMNYLKTLNHNPNVSFYELFDVYVKSDFIVFSKK